MSCEKLFGPDVDLNLARDIDLRLVSSGRFVSLRSRALALLPRIPASLCA